MNPEHPDLPTVKIEVEFWSSAYNELDSYCKDHGVNMDTFLSAVGLLAVSDPDVRELVEEKLM